MTGKLRVPLFRGSIAWESRKCASVARSCEGRMSGEIRPGVSGRVPAGGPGSVARPWGIRVLLVRLLHLFVRGLRGVCRAQLVGVVRARLIVLVCMHVVGVHLRKRARIALGSPGPVVCATGAGPIGGLRVRSWVCVLLKLRPPRNRSGFTFAAPDPARGGEPAPITCPCGRRVGAHTVGCLRGGRPAVRSCGRKRKQAA